MTCLSTYANLLSRRRPGPGRPGSAGTGGGQTITVEAEGRVLKTGGGGKARARPRVKGLQQIFSVASWICEKATEWTYAHQDD